MPDVIPEYIAVGNNSVEQDRKHDSLGTNGKDGVVNDLEIVNATSDGFEERDALIPELTSIKQMKVRFESPLQPESTEQNRTSRKVSNG
jgi:hypothetical protein